MTKNEEVFQLVECFDVEYAPTSIKKWRSNRTGLEVVYINQPSPIVNGYFAVATEVPNNSGTPHTLEHLIFMGSKQYPYKGLLDSLGNRFFSSTNAWTSTDQTVYTLTTAGWEGFKTLLPIYLDHLVNPTLTEEACLTEVFHIDGKGNEKGVVFSEMQGIETQSWFITFLKMQETLYAKDSGYSSETGGLMSELRHLTNDEIRKFHKLMYRPDNLSVIITGSIDELELLDIMNKFDHELIPLPKTPNKRPFVDSIQVEPLKQSIVKSVDFPEKDESMGEIVISWIGPRFDDNINCEALDIVGAYFSDLPISILNKNLIEIENPLATDIEYNTDDYLNIVANFLINGVPTNKLQEVDNKVKQLIKQQTIESNFDLDLMRQIINQSKLKLISQSEKLPTYFQNSAILDFIYGDKQKSNLTDWCKDLEIYDVLLSWDASKWCEFINRFFVEVKSASILGKPSLKLNKSMKLENKQRKQEILDKYGKQGLIKLGETLKKAELTNDLPIPDSLLTQFGKPDPSQISFIRSKSYKAGSNDLTIGYESNQDDFNKLLLKDSIDNNPLFYHLEQFKSQFITIHLVMSTLNVDKHYLRYLPILEEIFNMSIKYDDKVIPYEELNSLLNKDLVEYELDNGFDGQFLENIAIKVKCEYFKYDKAIDWILKIMKFGFLEENRIKIIIEKIINSLPEKKRDDELMMYSKQYRTLYNDNSIRKAHDFIHNEPLYKELLEKINNNKFHEIAKDLNNFKDQLFRLNNIKVFVNGNVEKLPTPISSWSNFINTFNDKTEEAIIPISKFPRSCDYRSEIGVNCRENAYIVSVPAAESIHLTALTLIPTNYLDEDIFKIALASEYLSTIEGPFWRGVRGKGLAYGVSISRNIETGYLTFTIYRGSDAEQAWSISKSIVADFCNGVTKFDDISIENCISTIINTLANNESNVFDASLVNISDNVFRQRGPNYKKLLIEKLKAVKSNDLLEIMNKYFKPLFDANNSTIFASVPSSKSNQFKTFLADQGYSVDVEEVNGGSSHYDEDDVTESEDETGSEEETESEEESEESEESDEDDEDDEDEDDDEEDEGEESD